MVAFVVVVVLVVALTVVVGVDFGELGMLRRSVSFGSVDLLRAEAFLKKK